MLNKMFKNTEETKLLGKKLNLPIDEIQVYDDYVMYFWPNFWWFKHRKRMNVNDFYDLMTK